MLSRAEIIDANFVQALTSLNFPKPLSHTSLKQAGLSEQAAFELFDSQVTSRLLDLVARELKTKNLSFYTIGSSGHEGNAVLGQVFKYTDPAFLHYRDCALMIERSKQVKGINIIKDLLLSLMTSINDPISQGRHKVLGSKKLNIPPQTSTIGSHAPKALGVALSIKRAQQCGIKHCYPFNSVVLASFGDASYNHATVQTALNTSEYCAYQNIPLPIVWVCEDNGIGISVKTPEGFIQSQVQGRNNLIYLNVDGLNIADCFDKAKQALQFARVMKKPVFFHMHCVRLLGHAGSDIEQIYLKESEILAAEANDPLLHTARILCEQTHYSAKQLRDHYLKKQKHIRAMAEKLLPIKHLESNQAVMQSIIKPIKKLPKIKPATKILRKKIFGDEFSTIKQRYNMSQCINAALTDLMLEHPEIVLLGEDVGSKGGVYRVTKNLQKRFGKKRVFDTLLDETAILGTAIGMAHNGFMPIPEIQFLAYYHNAEDQIRGEAASLQFFSNGQFSNPLIVRIAGLGYQKGFGGHFHNDNSLAALRDIPGVLVACPSNGMDAAKMLRHCVQLSKAQGRVVLFIEPIALYMTKDLNQPGDNDYACIYPEPAESLSLDEVGIYGHKKAECVILTYGNGVYLSRQAMHYCQQLNLLIKIVDLRWLAPLPEAAILEEIKNAKQILIVDEGRRAGSISEALMSLILEKCDPVPKVSRITGDDCFIPLGHSWQYILPSRDIIIKKIKEYFHAGFISDQ